MPFPHEPIPGGNVWRPHHYSYALIAVMLLLAVIWDNYDSREPLTKMASVEPDS